MAGDLVIGSFLKSPAIATVELLAAAGFDYLVIDQEHAPIDRSILDTMIFATVALGMGALVRIPTVCGEHILSALDLGADGVLAPHVSRPDIARSVVAAGRFSGSRGYSGAVRAAGYGARKMADVVAEADRKALSVAQIEDAEALDHLDAVATCDGIDVLFIGRGDLAVSLGPGAAEADVWRTAETIAQAAIRAGKRIGGFAESAAAALRLREMGATLIILGSDQGFLRRGAAQGISELRQSIGP